MGRNGRHAPNGRDGETEKVRNDAETTGLMGAARIRAGSIDKYVDMIPARFYLSSEALQAHKPRANLDPAQYKPTSQILVEVLTAEAAAASAGSSSEAKQNKKKEKKRAAAAERASLEAEGPSSRGDLRTKLEDRINELKEARRQKQSTADKEKHAKEQAAQKQPPREDAAPAAKRQRADSSPRTSPKLSPKLSPKAAPILDDDDVLAGRLSFEPRVGELPFEAQVNKRGHKVKELRSKLRKEETKIRKLDEAEGDDRDALRTQFALDTALRRARGERVHDDVTRLRKQQKHLEVKKAKGQEKWHYRVEQSQTTMQEAQTKRKENLQAQRGNKKKAVKNKARIGFEGKNGAANSDVA